MTIIWGGSGFIGGHLLRELAEQGHKLLVLSRNPDQLGGLCELPQVEVEKLDFRLGRDTGLRSWLRESSLVYNVAGRSGSVGSNRDPLADLEANAESQLLFLQACAESNARPHIVFSSTRLVYGVPQSLPVRESHPTRPDSFYAAHKLAAENYHRILGAGGAFTYTICRISNAYGYDPAISAKSHGILGLLAERACNGEPLDLFGGGTQLRDFIHADDLAPFLVECGKRPEARNEVFNVGYGKSITLAELSRQISLLTGAVVRDLPWPEEYSLVETGDFRVDISKAVDRLGFAPQIDPVVGLLRTVRQYQVHHELVQEGPAVDRNDEGKITGSPPTPQPQRSWAGGVGPKLGSS